jgi:hemolysin activation/secretion protein
VRAQVVKAEGLPGGDQSPCFPLERVTLEGEDAQEFHWALEAAQGHVDAPADSIAPRCVGRETIAGIVQRVQGALISKGFVTTRVRVPAQDLRTGVLRLMILPGRIGTVHMEGDALGRGTAWNALPLQPGQRLNLRDLEQGLENFQRVPTVQADIQIAPSEPTPDRPEVRPGDSDLYIRWSQGRPFRLALTVDDSGTRATGRTQGALTFSYDNALDLNDLFYVTVQGSLRDDADGQGGVPAEHANRGHTLHYSLPWGRWLLALQASVQDYRQVVAGASQVYVYRGETRQQDLRLSRLVHRDAVSKTTLSVRAWHRQSSNFIDDTEIEVQRRRTAGWELGAQHQRTIGAAALSLGISYRRGTGAAGALAAPEDAFGEGASRPRIVNADLSLSLPLGVAGADLRYGVTASGQWSRQPLVPQDRFAIGGRYSVRGFDGEQTLSAARGGWLRQELQWAFAGSGQSLYLGLDHGEVGGAASESLVGTRLTGVVLGLRGGWRRASWDLFAGRPIRRPSMFRTADRTAGFSLQVSF